MIMQKIMIIEDDFALPSETYHSRASQNFKLMRNRGLIDFQYFGQVGYAHFGNAERGQNLNSGTVRKNAEEFGEIVKHGVVRQIIFDKGLRAVVKQQVHMRPP